MDFKTFIVEILGKAIWPITVLLLAFYFKDSLKEIFSRITRFQHRDTILEFEKGVEKIQEVFYGEPPPIESATPHDTRFDYILELKNLPSRSAIIEAWLMLEAEIDKLYYKYYQGTKVASPLRKLISLHEKNVMDGKAFEIIDMLRQLRNKAAHEAKFDVSQAALNAYLEVVYKVVSALNAKNTI